MVYGKALMNQINNASDSDDKPLASVITRERLDILSN